jgi:hypothetical protein
VRIVSFILCLGLISTSVFAAAIDKTKVSADAPLDTNKIEKIMGMKGRMDNQTHTFKILFPRTDLNILLNGVKLTPAMGLTSWAAFRKTSNTTTVKADIVVTENQVNTILGLALDNHLAVIALHNHLLWESPRVMFVHVEGVGDEQSLADAIQKVFKKTQDTNDEASDFPLAAIDASDTTLNPGNIDRILGTKGQRKNGGYQIHTSKISASQNKKDKTPFIITSATFAGSDGEAVLDGDLALRSSDLHSVLTELHKANIAIVALHQHESNSTATRTIYLHYFGVGSAKVLAGGLRNALEVAKANDIENSTPSVALLVTPAPSKVAAASHAKPQVTPSKLTVVTPPQIQQPPAKLAATPAAPAAMPISELILSPPSKPIAAAATVKKKQS